METDVRGVPDEELWALRSGAYTELVAYVRKHLARQRAIQGASPEEIEDAERVFNCDVLTLGFARRFATYKPTIRQLISDSSDFHEWMDLGSHHC